MEDGESTQYFYSLEKNCQVGRSITTLTKDNLDTITDTAICPKHTIQTDIPKLLPIGQHSCESRITLDKLRRALTTMENNKSPDFDSLITNFYKHFSPLLEPDLTQVFNFAFDQGLLASSQCRGIISLFKKGKHSRLQNWRPITLLKHRLQNLDYSPHYPSHLRFLRDYTHRSDCLHTW